MTITSGESAIGQDEAGRPARVSPRAGKTSLFPELTPVVADAGASTIRSHITPEAIEPRQRSERLNRVVNVALAVIAIILTSPLLLLIAVAIKLTSPGPILYSQARVGLDRRRSTKRSVRDRRILDLGGAPFRIYKFRSMSTDAERLSGAIWATPGDPRVTAVGRVLRQCRLDELPQFLNVLDGSMNIVGPRPERPSICARLRKEISGYSLRQRSKPGITGWAQVNRSYDTTIDGVAEKLRYDLEYVQRQSLAEDARIMLKTAPVVLMRSGGW